MSTAPIKNKRVRQAMAGAGAGAITKSAVAPLERVKILFQIQGMKGETGSTRKYRGMMQALRLITKEEGVVALWRPSQGAPLYFPGCACNITGRTQRSTAGPFRLCITRIFPH